MPLQRLPILRTAAVQPVTFMVAGGLLLGTLGVFVEEAGQHPLTSVWFRCVFGVLALTLWLLATGRLHELRLAPRQLALAGAVGVLMLANWALFFAAIQRTSIAMATVVFHVQPFIVMGLSAWWLQERVTGIQWTAAGVGLVGLAMATGLADRTAGAHGVGADPMGIAMCLGGALCYALVILAARRAQGVSPVALSWWQCAVGTAALVWWPWLHGWPAWGPEWAWLAGLGVLHTGLAYVLLFAGMAGLAAGRIALLQFVYPVTAIAMDALVYGRTLAGSQAWGAALILVALLAVAARGGGRRA